MNRRDGLDCAHPAFLLQCIYDLRFPKPLLLLPVEHLRRVYALVSDLPAQLIQMTHP